MPCFNARMSAVPLPEFPEVQVVRPVFSAKSALDQPPAVNWLVEGFLARPSLNVIVGDPGNKKTILALDLAVSVALGTPWLGHPVTQTPVLFVDEESGLQAFWKRANAALNGHQAGAETPFHFISPGNYDFRDYWETQELATHVIELGAKLIIIDALTNVLRGGDENSVPSVSPLFSNLRHLALRHEVAILLLHHTNRSGAFRGSSAISAAVDLMLHIESDQSSPHLHLYPLKTRDVMPQPIHAQAHFEPGKFWLSPSDDQDLQPLNPHERSILARIKEFGEIYTQDLMDSSTSSPSTINKTLYELRNAGFIQRVNPGTRGKAALLALTPKGHAHVSHA